LKAKSEKFFHSHP